MKQIAGLQHNRKDNSVTWAFLATFFILVARAPDRVFVPGFWAEDGAVFLRDALIFPFWENLLRPNLGYLQILQRAVAGLTVALNLFSPAPLLWNLFSFILAAALLSCFASSLYITLIPQRIVRFTLPVLIAASGAVFEVLGNLTNIHSYLALVGIHLIVYLYAFPLHVISRKKIIIACSVILLSFLSSPYCFVFIPFILLAWWQNHERRHITQLILVGCFLLSCSFQAISYVNYQRHFSAQTTQFDSSILIATTSPTAEKISPAKTISVWIKRVVTANFIPAPMSEALLMKGLIGLLGFFAMMMVMYLCISQPHRNLKSGLLLFTFLNVLVLYAGRPLVLSDIAHTGFLSYFAGRYFFITMASCWLITAIVVGNQKKLSNFLVLIVILQLTANLSFFSSQITSQDFHWSEYAAQLTARSQQQQIKIPINPPGWFIELP